MESFDFCKAQKYCLLSPWSTIIKTLVWHLTVHLWHKQPHPTCPQSHCGIHTLLNSHVITALPGLVLTVMIKISLPLLFPPPFLFHYFFSQGRAASHLWQRETGKSPTRLGRNRKNVLRCIRIRRKRDRCGVNEESNCFTGIFLCWWEVGISMLPRSQEQFLP